MFYVLMYICSNVYIYMYTLEHICSNVYINTLYII